MKATPFIIALALAAPVAAATPDAPTAASAERIAALKDSFRFTPIAATKTALAAVPDDIVVLEQLTITESMSRRALAEQIQRRWQADRLLEFSWDKGGLLFVKTLRGTTAEFGIWPLLEERKIGITSARDIALRLDLVHMRW